MQDYQDPSLGTSLAATGLIAGTDILVYAGATMLVLGLLIRFVLFRRNKALHQR